MNLTNKTNKKEVITEEMGVHKDWYEQAKSIKTTDEAKAFADHVTNDYRHDYGTVCHAIAASSLGMFNALAAQEGITGFQASCIAWEIIRRLFHIEGGAKLIKYEDMLYPQYENKFDKTISKDTFEWLQQEAKNKLHVSDSIHPAVEAHLESIVNGTVPFGYTVKED